MKTKHNISTLVEFNKKSVFEFSYFLLIEIQQEHWMTNDQLQLQSFLLFQMNV